MHVDVAGESEDTLDHRARHEFLPPVAPGGADYELCRIVGFGKQNE
jgi:hypothetical protein